MPELIMGAMEGMPSEYPPKAVYLAIVKELTMPDVVAIRFGNTLFIVHKSNVNEKQGFFRALNCDTAANYLENSREFVKKMQEMKMETLVTQFTDSSILNIFKAIARDKPEGMGYAAQKSKDGKKYQVTLQLVPRK